jgi:radial spoke head protein 1
VYHGGFNLGKKYGNGVFEFPNGTRLEGFWDNNHIEGFVRVYYHNGDYYEGNFHMSEKSGEGVYKWN